MVYFNKALFLLSNQLKKKEYSDVKKIILPIGIRPGIVDELWLCRYYEVVKKFAHEICFYGKQCYLVVKNSYFNAIDNFITKNVIINNKAKSLYKDMKTSPWKDVDEKWFNELIFNKEEDLLHIIVKSASISSNSNTIIYDGSQDVPDT